MLKVKIALVIACAVSMALVIYHVARADAPPQGSGEPPRLSGGTALALQRLGYTVTESTSAPAAVTPLSAYFLTPLFPGAPGAQTPLGANFQGLGFVDTGYFPPDGGVATGPNHVMQVVNVHYAVYNKYGSMYAIDSLENFFRPVLSTLGAYNTVSDPRVLYDAARGRWLVTLLVMNYQTDGSGNGWVLLGVSPGSDPTEAPGLWHQIIVTTTRGSGTARSFGDFDTLGYDSRNVYIGTNQFTFGAQAWQGNDLFVLNRADAYGLPGATVSQQRFNNVNCLSSAQPVGGDDDPLNGYFVSWSRCSATQFIVQPIIGTAPSASLAAQVTLNTLNVKQPPLARQLNGPNTIDTIDGRVMNAVYRNGSLWTAHAISPTASGDGSAVIHWLQINPATKTVVQEGLYSLAATDLYYPMIAVDSRNNALLLFNRSSATEHIGAWYAVRLSSDSPNTFGAPSLLKSGVDQYYRYWDAGDTRNRWGDYNGVALDPNGYTVWMEAAYGDTRVPPSPNGSYGNWTTWIGATDLPYPLLPATAMLASALNPSVYGQAVTLTARVTSTAGGGVVPTGTLLFKIDSTAVTTTLDALGSAATITHLLSAGTHVITATYLGNKVYSSTASAPLAQIVNKAGTSVTAGAIPHPSTFGQAVTITLRAVSAIAGVTPTGYITLSTDGWSAALALDAVGSATYVTSTLGAGAHPMTATYGGAANFTGSGATFAQTVNKAASTTSISATSPATIYGQTVTFTVQVASGVAGFTPTGALTLTIDEQNIVLALDANGSAAFVTDTLAAGAHAITAMYGGDQNYNASAAIHSHSVARAATSITLAAAPSTASTYGQVVTFTAQVASSQPGFTPSGVLTLSVDAAQYMLALDAAGSASYTTTALGVGAHAITATFAGDANYLASSAALVQMVRRAATSAQLETTANPSTVWSPLTFTVQILSSTAGVTPTGNVTLSVDAAHYMLALDDDGSAAYVTDTLGAGSHTIAAAYGGNALFTASGATLTQTVQRAPVSVTLAATPNPSVYNQTVTFTAQVSGSVASFTPTGVLTLSVGAANMVYTLGASDSAVYVTHTLGGGDQLITATYGGDANFDDAEAVLTQTVQRASTLVGTGTDPHPSEFGQAVTITLRAVSLSPGITPTGIITLGIEGWSAALALDATGTATYVTSTLSVQTHVLTAEYSGDANFRGSSAFFFQTVYQTNSNTRLTAEPNPSTYGETVTFTAQVTSDVPGFTPNGAVTLSAGGADIPLMLDANGVAVYATSTLSIAAHAITATYGGDVSYFGSWASITLNVDRAIAHPGVTVSPTPSTLRQPVTFTLQVTSSVAGITPTGNVTLSIDAVKLLLPLDALGGATYVTDSLIIATHAVTLTYAGDANFSGGMASLTHTVRRAPTVASVAGAPNPAPFTRAVTFTLQVTSGLAGLTPTGAITLSIDGARIPLSLDAGGRASYITGTLHGGAHVVATTYGGDASYDPSSAAFTQVISRAASTTTVNATPAAVSELGQKVTFTLQVSSSVAGFTPTGAITLSVDGANIALALNAAGGVSYTTATLTGGAHAITATYSGDIDFDISAASLAYTVNQTGTTALLASQVNPSTYGQAVTFTAHITSNVAGFTPTGAITFSIGATQVAVPLGADGSATVITSALSAGAHAISATYFGDASHIGSSAVLTQTVIPATPALILSAAPDPAAVSQTVTVALQLMPPYSNGVWPTGSVTLTIDASAFVLPLDAFGAASVVTNSLSAGVHVITATYRGDSNFNPAGAAITLTVLPVYQLTLNTAGNGSGVIETSPTGVPFAQGTVVTLTALPAADSSFIGWSGALSGTQNPLTLTLNGDAAVTATFALNVIIGMIGNSPATTITVAPPSVGLGDRVTATITLSGSVSNRLLGLGNGPSIGSLTLDVTATLDSRLLCAGVDPAGVCDDFSHTARWSGVTVTMDGPVVPLTAFATLGTIGPLSDPLPAPLVINYTAVDVGGSGMYSQVSAPVAVRPYQVFLPLAMR